MPPERRMEAKGSVSGRCQFCNAQLSLIKPDGGNDRNTNEPNGIIESIFTVFDRECHLNDSNPPSTSGSSGAKKDVEVGSDDDSFVLLDSPREASSSHASWSADDVAVMNKVLDVCSRVTGIQQPLCADCSNDLYRELEQGIEEMRLSKEAYEALCRKLSQRVDGNGVVNDGEEEEEKLAHELMVWECVLEC